jgi:hypothetical protein
VIETLAVLAKVFIFHPLTQGILNVSKLALLVDPDIKNPERKPYKCFGRLIWRSELYSRLLRKSSRVRFLYSKSDYCIGSVCLYI